MGAAVVWVRSGATGGDGSMAAPYGTIGEGLAAASPGSIVAVAAGTYAEALDVPDGVTIHGACAERTIVRTPSASSAAAGVRAGRTATLERLTLGGAGPGVLAYGAVTLRGVAIESATSGGIGVLGGTLDAERVLVRDTQPDAGGRLGRGIEIDLGGSATLRDVVVERARGAGIALNRSGGLVAAGVGVRGTLPNAAGRFGSGISAFDASTIDLDAVAIEGASEAGLLVDGSTATVRRTVIRDVASEPATENGSGLFARTARVHLAEVWIERSTRAGISAYAGTTLDAADVLVESVAPSTSGTAVGAGSVSSAVTIERAVLRDLAFAALIAAGDAATETSIVARDVRVQRVAATENAGEAVIASGGAVVELRRFAAEDLTTLAAQALGPGTRLVLELGTIARVAEGAVYDVGRGIEIDEGAAGAVTDVRVEGVRETAIVAYGAGSTLALTRVSIEGISERACAAGACPGEGGGSGVAAVFGAAIDARDLHVTGAPLCGVQVAEGAMLDVRSGTLERNAIGACVQVPGYDLARVVDGVVFRDNDTNVDTGGRFVPPPGMVPSL
jgi:hypothetical protein